MNTCCPLPRTMLLAAAVACMTVQAPSGAAASSSPASPTWPLDVRLEFRTTSFAASIGSAGLHAVDLDGDGIVEIVTTAARYDYGPADFWYVLSRRGSDFRQSWVSQRYGTDPGELTSLTVGNVDGDPAPEVIVGAGARVYVYDGRTRDLEQVIDTHATEIRSLQVSDPDSDGGVEIVFCAPDGLHSYDARTGLAEFERLLGSCRSVAVGNVDADPAPELVVANGTDTGYVVDGVHRSVQWAYPLGFGEDVRLGDLDGDGVAEIVAIGVQHVSVLDAVSTIEEGAVYAENDVGAAEVADVEGDGVKEIVWGDGQWGNLHVVDGSSLIEKWAMENPSWGFSNIVVANLDADGARELLWAGRSGGPLKVVDSESRTLEWHSPNIYAPFFGQAYGDVDGNGKPDLLYASREWDDGDDRGPSGGPGVYFVHGAITKRLRYASPPQGNSDLPLLRIRVADADADPQLEIFVGAHEYSRGMLLCRDGLTHAEQWRALLDDGDLIRSMQVGDVDGDGRLEVVVGSLYVWAPQSHVYVFDAATGAREWRSAAVGDDYGDLSLLRLAQVDADRALEILVAEHQRGLYLFDGSTHDASFLGTYDVTALDAIDLDGNGRDDILVGTADGRVLEIAPRPRGGRPRLILRGEGWVDGLVGGDLNHDGSVDFVVARGGRLSFIDGRNQRVLWESDYLGRNAGSPDGLLLADIDRDGRLELMVNNGETGLEIYEVALPPPPAS